MYNINDLKTVWIGRRGETRSRVIQIDVSSIETEYPDAAIDLIMRTDPDGEPMLCLTEVTDGILYWTITAAETAEWGEFPFEIHAANDGVLVKSVTGTAIVDVTIGGDLPEDAPEAIQTWVDSLEMEVGWARRLRNVEAETETLAAGEAATAQIEQTSDTTTFTFGIPKGEKGEKGDTGSTGSTGPIGPSGEDGVSPEVTITSGTGSHTVKITDAAHPTGQTFTVLDGDDGVSPEVTIAAKDGGHRITITDAEHPEGVPFDVMDGVSPEVTVTDDAEGHHVRITDAEHPDGQTFTVTDGVGSWIDISDITGGHRLTIHDANYPEGRTVDVMNGDDGEDGEDGGLEFATFDVDPATGILSVTYSEDPSEYTFAINDGRLEVSVG